MCTNIIALADIQVSSLNTRFDEGTAIPENEEDIERRKTDEKRTTRQLARRFVWECTEGM